MWHTPTRKWQTTVRQSALKIAESYTGACTRKLGSTKRREMNENQKIKTCEKQPFSTNPETADLQNYRRFVCFSESAATAAVRMWLDILCPGGLGVSGGSRRQLSGARSWGVRGGPPDTPDTPDTPGHHAFATWTGFFHAETTAEVRNRVGPSRVKQTGLLPCRLQAA